MGGVTMIMTMTIATMCTQSERLVPVCSHHFIDYINGDLRVTNNFAVR